MMCPGSLNAIVGIKPTVGRVSRAGLVPISAEQDTAGPVTRSLTDAAAVLSVIQGVDRRDPATEATARYVDRDYVSALQPHALQGSRIGVWRGRRRERRGHRPARRDDRAAAIAGRDRRRRGAGRPRRGLRG